MKEYSFLSGFMPGLSAEWRFFMKIQKAVKDETIKVAAGEAIGVAVMFLVWLIIHLLAPAVPFDYKVVLAAVLGGIVAVGNFLLLGLSVQRLAAIEDSDAGKRYFKSTYRKRMLLQILWGVLAFALPCFNGIAGVIPLLFPTFIIRTAGVKDAVSGMLKKEKTGEASDGGKPKKDIADEAAGGTPGVISGGSEE